MSGSAERDASRSPERGASRSPERGASRSPERGASRSPERGASRDPTQLRKRSLSIAGHATSISLEDVFWDELAKIAEAENCSIAALVRRIDATRTGNLSSAVRVHVLERLRAGTSGSSPEATD